MTSSHHTDPDQKETAESDSPEQQTLLRQIRTEIDELKAVAGAFGVKRIKDGSWFNEFIRAMLDTYAQKIIDGGGVAFFRRKYPGLTQEQIAVKLCDLATRYAALAGGASGFTSSAAVAATFGTLGGAGPVAIPASIAALSAEMFYTTRLQIRLIYDLSIIYGYPIDLTDPEDLYRAFAMAYGLAFTTGNAGFAIKTATPEVARTYLRGLMYGHMAAVRQVAIRVLGPEIGKKITQRALLRASVPVVGIGLSATWNYVSTGHMAEQARAELRARGKVRDAVRALGAEIRQYPQQTGLALEAILTIATADEVFDQYEQEVYRYIIQDAQLAPEVLESLEQRVDFQPASIEQRLRSLNDPSLCNALANCLKLVAAADGSIHINEASLVRGYLTALNTPLHDDELANLAQEFARPRKATEQVKDTVKTATRNVKDRFAAVTRWGNRPTPAKPAEDDAAPTQKPADPIDRIIKLTTLHATGALTDEEFNTAKQHLLAQL